MPTAFQPIGKIDDPKFRPRPAGAADQHVEFSDGELTVYFSKTALDRMIRHALALGNGRTQRDRREAIGRLLGRSYRDGQGDWTFIGVASCAERAASSRTFVRSSIEDELSVDQSLDTCFLTHDRMGWWHNHPHLHLPNYSGTDVENQRVACPRPDQVGALVCIDDGYVEVHVFAGPESRPLGQIYRVPYEPSADAAPERRETRDVEREPATMAPARDWRSRSAAREPVIAPRRADPDVYEVESDDRWSTTHTVVLAAIAACLVITIWSLTGSDEGAAKRDAPAIRRTRTTATERDPSTRFTREVDPTTKSDGKGAAASRVAVVETRRPAGPNPTATRSSATLVAVSSVPRLGGLHPCAAPRPVERFLHDAAASVPLARLMAGE